MRSDGPPDADEIEWLDEHSAPVRPDEDLPGADRPPPSRRRRMVIGALTAIVLAGGVVAAVVVDNQDGERQAAPTRAASTSPARSNDRSSSVELPQRAPRSGIAAIRSAFPGADLVAFVAARSDDPSFGLRLTYNARIDGRLLTVSVEPARPGQDDHVFRTATSFQLGLQRGPAYVDALIRRDRGTPTARDYARLQNLVLDNRLLATR